MINVNTSSPIKSADEESEQTEKTALKVNEEEMTSSPDNDIDDAFNNYGTAAFSLQKKIDTDLSINTSGNLFTEQYSKLEQELSSKAQEGKMYRILYTKKMHYTLCRKIIKKSTLMQNKILSLQKKYLTVKTVKRKH